MSFPSNNHQESHPRKRGCSDQESHNDFFYKDRIIHKSRLNEYFESYYERLIGAGIDHKSASERSQGLKATIVDAIKREIKKRQEGAPIEGTEKFMVWASKKFGVSLNDLTGIRRSELYSFDFQYRPGVMGSIHYSWNHDTQCVEITVDFLKLDGSSPAHEMAKRSDEEYRKKKQKYRDDFDHIKELLKRMKPAPTLGEEDSATSKQSMLFASLMAKNYPEKPILHIDSSRIFKSKMFQIISKINVDSSDLPPWEGIVGWCAHAGILKRKEYDEFKDIF